MSIGLTDRDKTPKRKSKHLSPTPYLISCYFLGIFNHCSDQILTWVYFGYNLRKDSISYQRRQPGGTWGT